MLKLSIQDAEGRSTLVPLTDGELSIGRDEANSICLTDRNVSRQHARLITKNGHVWVENVAATYGTRFNSLLLRDKAEMREGDVVQVGDYVLELVSDEAKKRRDTALKDEAPAPAKPPAPPQASKGKAPDGATAIVNLADIQAMLTKEPAAPTTSIPEASQPRLVVESENLRGLELRITKTPVVVGRVRESSDLVIDHRSISKEHARLTRMADGNWQVLDLGSANGLKVNGEPYSKCDIRSGDRIELGHVSLRFLAPGAKAPAVSEGAATGGGKSNALIFVAIGAVVLIGGAVAAFLLLGGKKGEEGDKPTPQMAGPAEPGKEKPAEDKGAEAAAEDQGDSPDQAIVKADKLVGSGMYAEAATLLKQQQEKTPGNPKIELKLRQIQAQIDAKDKLDAAEKELETDPASALAKASEVKGTLPAESPMVSSADSIIEMAKKKLSEKKAVGPKTAPREAAPTPEVKPKTEPKVEPKAEVKPKTEPKVEPKAEVKPKAEEPKPEPAAKKTGKELYDEARNAMLAGDTGKAIDLFKQAAGSGFGKAHGQLARVYFQKGDKGNCAKHAKAYLDKYPDAGDAPQIQNLLEKCQ